MSYALAHMYAYLIPKCVSKHRKKLDGYSLLYPINYDYL